MSTKDMKQYKSEEILTSDSDSEYVPEGSDSEIDPEEEQFNRKEYQKFLMNMFPSKYLAQKIGDSENGACCEDSDGKGKSKKSKNIQSNDKKRNKKNKKIQELEEEDDEEEYVEDVIDVYDGKDEDGDEEDSDIFSDEYDEGDEGDEGDELLQIQGLPFNIVLNIKGLEDEGDEDEDEDDDDDDDEEENVVKKATKSKSKGKVKSSNKNNPTKKKKQEQESVDETGNSEQEVVEKLKLYSSKDMEHLVKLLEAMKTDENTKSNLSNVNEKDTSLNEVDIKVDASNNEVVSSMVNMFKIILKEKKDEEEIKKKKQEKKDKKKMKKQYTKLIKEKTNLNDLSYFQKQDVEQQKHIIEMLTTIKNSEYQETPYRIRLIESKLEDKFKAIVLKKINMLKRMDPYQGEYYKLKMWVDNFMMIPFGVYKTLDISLNDGIEKSNEFMMNAKNILDSVVYGLDDAKMQILQMLGQLITNPSSVGSSIAIKGPMGTGKTTLVKEGISKILNRPFAFVALGGATDSVFLEGHSYTYEGSTWGHIVEILKQSKCMNPVIYFDELDKVSDTAKGEEIIGILTHLTDTTQNTQFHDKYFAGIDFDLSKCMFIFSYNDESKINPILRDRMYKISTEGYKPNEKKIIARKHLLPAIETNTGFDKESIKITDDVFDHIIENYTGEEKGVRNLKRCIEIIFTKLNMFRLMKPGIKLYDDFETLDISFPYTLEKETMQKLLKKNKKSEWLTSMYT